MTLAFPAFVFILFTNVKPTTANAYGSLFDPDRSCTSHVLQVHRNDTLYYSAIFCNLEVTEQRFPLHRSPVSHPEYVIGFYRHGPKQSRICYYQKVENDQTELTSLGGGTMHTIGYISCPPGFQLVSCYCLSLVDSVQTFDWHKDNCIGKGGYLASISSSDENSAIMTYLADLGNPAPYILIGLKDMVGLNKMTDYKWIKDNSSMLYSNWNSVEPNASDQRCVVLCGYTISSNVISKWTDVFCTTAYAALCEADLVMVPY